MSSNQFPALVAVCATLALAPGALRAQQKTDAPRQPSAAPDPSAPGARIGDPYPFDTCPISGKKLGQMGDPVVRLYEGREVRFCCPSCPARFEKDLSASLAALDEKIIKDQSPLYPLKTSVVTGQDLPDHPYEFVYGNRLIRLGAESEKAEFLKDPRKNLDALNKAVIAAQGDDYPISKCPVSGDEFGGAMGKPRDMVIAGRLIRLCCPDCKKDVEADPAKFVALVDEARKGQAAPNGKDPKPRDGAPPHGGQGQPQGGK